MTYLVNDLDPKIDSLRKVALIDYLLHIGGMVLTFGTLTLIAIVLNYFKRGEARGTWVGTHVEYMIKYWWRWVMWMIGLGLVIGLLGLITLGLGFFVLGWIFAVPSIIFVIRMVLGLLKLNAGQPVDV
jgi:uncharacterized membrane protein